MNDLVSTERDAGRTLELRSPSIHAVAIDRARAAAEPSFVYRGPARGAAPLASGEMRRQIGLKLRALDTCNVVYVMWHIEPTRGIHVSVKANPTAHDHEACGDRGYEFPTASSTREPAAIMPGQRHTLSEGVDAVHVLHVSADGAPVWEGTLPDAAFAFDGPIGLRADNGDFDVELRAPAD